ncbi:hypothetical protein F8388_019117 [Cannabis sativa]|uniref:Uncharacterized protein n=1 Tax=Cannabis sativa TaxID=3483 RepID=A0A7J6FF45_CANSA|nr:hypothetical protein F8388_019117 [Cannabis sativa]
MRSKKDKILQVLRVLESIIPGVKGKDPLLVIDEAIDYLRIAKLKAETLGSRKKEESKGELKKDG